jgi:hypothetical protein
MSKIEQVFWCDVFLASHHYTNPEHSADEALRKFRERFPQPLVPGQSEVATAVAVVTAAREIPSYVCSSNQHRPFQANPFASSSGWFCADCDATAPDNDGKPGRWR